ncbi:MAG: alpha-amylase family glycosyl hydrolase [Bacteroidota bacterium]
MKRWIRAAWLLAAGFWTLHAQDSVDVTFRYAVTPFPTGLEVRGEADNWGSPPAWLMQYQGGNLWSYTARLRIGGHQGGGVPGGYQYKFWHNGITGNWPNDPLNHHVNTSDNDNTVVYVRNPTIYHFLPNQRSGTVGSEFPVISAYLYPAVGSTLDTGSITLTIDGTPYTGLGSGYNPAAKLFSVTSPVSLADGGHSMILRAGSSADTVTFIVQVGGPPVAPLPPYARHGVTLPQQASNDSTTFRLRVGGTTYVVLRVAPLGQPVSSAPPVFMRKNPSSDDWWLNVKLPPGTYEYQYQTSSGALFNDPWGRHTGTFGTRFTVGPEGLSADDYVWRSTSYTRPPLEKLVIYELHVGEFAGGFYGLPAGQAGFPQLTTLLPYLDSLGVNAVELMPINDFGLVGPSGHSWGYDHNSHFALEPSYGSPRDFKVFVDSAHARGIAVIVDMVLNHLNDTGPLWKMQPDVGANPYFKAFNDLRYNEDYFELFRDMDHWTDETQEYVTEALKMWIDQYRVDGYRYDLTQGIGWNVNEPTRGVLGWANRIAQDYSGAVYQIAEHLPESPALIYYSGLTGGWHDSFRDEIFDEARFRNTSLLDFENLILDLGAYPGNDTPSLPNRYANRTEPVNANVNHDEQSLIYEMTTFQGVPLPEALVRDRLYAVFMFTSLGIPMLWEGMELSAPRGWQNDGQKLSYRPVEWNLRPTARGQEHLGYYRSLIRQRTLNPALTRGTLRKLFRYNAEKVLVWGLEDTVSGARVMAVANLSGFQRTVAGVPWLAPGAWYDIWTQALFQVSSVPLDTMTLAPYTARVYSTLSDSILLPVAQDRAALPREPALRQNYPNPFNPSTTILFDIAAAGGVKLEVFTVAGRRVRTLRDGAFPAGRFAAVWDGTNDAGEPVSSGVYIYRLTAEGGGGSPAVLTNRMVLLR